MTQSKKRRIHVSSIEELHKLVDELLRTGEQPRVTFPPEMIADPRTYEELERLAWPEPEGDGEVREVITYAKGTEITYRGYSYGFEKEGEKFIVKVRQPCGGVIRPWDFAHDTVEDAEQHAQSYIDSVVQQEKP